MITISNFDGCVMGHHTWCSVCGKEEVISHLDIHAKGFDQATNDWTEKHLRECKPKERK